MATNTNDLLIQNNNFSRIVFVKTKVGYNLFIKYFNKYNKIKLDTTPVLVPFGIEEYNGKDIVNLRLNSNDNNSYNFVCDIRAIDKFFINLKQTDNKYWNIVQNDIKNKEYVSCLKDDNVILLRTHIKKTKHTIMSTFFEDGVEINPFKIKSRTGIFSIEVGQLWFNDTNYGLILYLNGGKICN